MQKLRERKLGIPADPAAASTNGPSARGRVGGGGAAIGEAEKEDLVLQDTFAQETAVTIEDPNMYFAVLLHLIFLVASVNRDASHKIFWVLDEPKNLIK